MSDDWNEKAERRAYRSREAERIDKSAAPPPPDADIQQPLVDLPELYEEARLENIARRATAAAPSPPQVEELVKALRDENYPPDLLRVAAKQAAAALTALEAECKAARGLANIAKACLESAESEVKELEAEKRGLETRERGYLSELADYAKDVGAMRTTISCLVEALQQVKDYRWMLANGGGGEAAQMILADIDAALARAKGDAK